MRYLVVFLILLATVAPAVADARSRAAQEAAEFVLQRFGREAAKDGTRALALRIERIAATHGGDVIEAVRRVGPKALPLVEQAGLRGRQVAGVLAAHGELGVVHVAARPRALALLERHGEEAAAALVQSRGAAEPVLEAFGQPAVAAFRSIAQPQNARRLAMLAESGELAGSGRATELLGVLAQFGDKGCEFVWKHKGALATTAALAAFLADPGSFINGARDITRVVAENVVKPVAEVPALAVRESAGEVARQTHWTAVFLAGIASTTVLFYFRWRRPDGPSNK